MKQLIFLVFLISPIFGINFIESSFSLKDCDNSKKKTGGKNFTFLREISLNNHIFGFHYFNGEESTKKPPMKKDLKIEKFAFKYGYRVSKYLILETNFLTIQDNLMPTDNGKMFGVGLTYQKRAYNFFGKVYKTVFDDFHVEQLDIGGMMRFKIGKSKNRLKVIGKFNSINGYKNIEFSPKSKMKNSGKDFYSTFGIILNSNYKNYLGQLGGFFGKRLFTVMKNGYFVQHHPMEVGNDIFIALGRKFKKVQTMIKFNQHKTKSLPTGGKKIDFQKWSLIVKYNF